jgi:hypothetical protein
MTAMRGRLQAARRRQFRGGGPRLWFHRSFRLHRRTGDAKLGPTVFPRFIAGSGFDTAPSSLSLWTDIESLMAFSYAGVHADALKHVRHWNVKPSWPALVLWWVGASHRPDWSEAFKRFEHLADEGPTNKGFTFKRPFGADGAEIAIDRGRVRELAGRNAETQRDLLAHVLTLSVQAGDTA